MVILFIWWFRVNTEISIRWLLFLGLWDVIDVSRSWVPYWVVCSYFLAGFFPLNGTGILCQKQQSTHALLSMSSGWSAVAVHILAEITFWKCVQFHVLCLHVCVKTPVLVHRFGFGFAYSCVYKPGFVCSHWNFYAYHF